MRPGYSSNLVFACWFLRLLSFICLWSIWRNISFCNLFQQNSLRHFCLLHPTQFRGWIWTWQRAVNWDQKGDRNGKRATKSVMGNLVDVVQQGNFKARKSYFLYLLNFQIHVNLIQWFPLSWYCFSFSLGKMGWKIVFYSLSWPQNTIIQLQDCKNMMVHTVAL